MSSVRTWLGLGSLLILTLLAACSPSTSDEEAQEKVLAEYIAAVQASDHQRIAKICTPGVDATADIATTITKIGGRQWRDVSISWRRGEFPDVAVATITAIDPTGQPITDSVVLSKVGDDWWIGLGSVPTDPASPPAETSRPT